ncbi:major paralogous domain-containing protein [Dyadobacter sp. SG02]|nr:major paralogous domain-containing protein [Dyadobacter sp. SG02]
MLKHYIVTVVASWLFTQVGIAQTTGTFTDSRDGQMYKTINFTDTATGKTVTWMAQNLNYKVEGSYAYKDDKLIEKSSACFIPGKARKKPVPSVGIYLRIPNGPRLWVNLAVWRGYTPIFSSACASITSHTVLRVCCF